MSSGGRPIRVLNVAEKPSVAKAVAGILSQGGGMRVREGRSRFNKIFEFGYTIRGQQCQMLFTSVTGHLMELDFDDRYRKWHSCDPIQLYRAPVVKYVPEDKLDIKRTLEEESRNCQWLVLWLDCDREGENIAFEVVEVCTQANRHLNVWRARFSALIDRDIRESVEALVRPNQLFADAVDVRQEIDLRIGASFTRFQTMLLRDAFHLDFARDNRNVVLSYGPCQFPTLGFIVERYWEIQSHEPEEFWTINCTHNSDEGIATFNWMRGHMFDYTCAVIIYEMCIQEPAATVAKVRQQEKLKYPPHPLSTIELEKRASRYFRISSEQTMKVAEDLYQAGFISYPRTETDCFSQRTDLRAIVQEQQGHPVWGSYAQRLLDPGEGLWRNPSGGGHDDKAHPPIHPTKFSSGESRWSQDHHRLYELVVRHFLACVSKPAVGAETTVEVDIAGELFSASGRVILEKNYLDVYRFESWGGSMIPTYTFGQQFAPTTLTLDSGVTRPPTLLSEADLLNSMDKAGIGTDATMHDHIKKLLDRCYATKDSNTRFSPTNLGEALVMGYDDMGYELWKPYLRAMMESDMKLVSMGAKRKAEVLETCLEQMKACFLDARSNKAKLFEAMEVFFERSGRSGADEQQAGGDITRRCGVCQESDMVLRRKPDGNFMVGCLGFPQCRNVVWLPGSVAEAAVTTNTCSICTPGPVFMIQFKFRRLEIPHNYNVDHLGCIGGCDDILKQLVEICGTGSRSTSTIPSRAGPTTTSSSNQQRNPRQIACTHCMQYGHSSNVCPSQVSHSSMARSQGVNQQNGDSSVPCETCGSACFLRTANTANNRGRKFYSCQSQGCNFFVWEDNLSNNNGGRRAEPANVGRIGHGRGGRSGRAAADTTFMSATGDPVSGRRCYVCGDPSHFANVCPSRGM
ncbi:DNA topoisomerase 3-alpha isoform X1 [Rhododendron vialii]|uniref:DNA topoisomerase 3-alpha isoform X1 n=1 Tax=Rhododendron vialii TaxID=182163 RepID=UPI00265EBF91|nr:DNA topoisomerase 3-alpha isoform X1 [Rhododendron vialii]